MEVIRDKDGRVIQRSRNLAGIRRYVSNHLIHTLYIDHIGEWEGKLCILFDDGASFESNFSSYEVLYDFVNRWKNVKGCLTVINGEIQE